MTRGHWACVWFAVLAPLIVLALVSTDAGLWILAHLWAAGAP